ncbi:MAG: nucleotide exchange factor GrpE [Pseudoflavonifractor sp.]
MSKKDKNQVPTGATDEQSLPPVAEDAVPAAEVPVPEVNPLQAEVDALTAAAKEQSDQFLRLAAEYDNFRRRSQKEKENIYGDAKGDTALAFLPVYDNLERALKQETCDEAYAKGVEMTMTGLKEVLAKLGVEEIPALGETFDPLYHNAVMHVEDAALGEGIIAEVFQTGFKSGDKVIRFAMVKVAN